MSLLLRNIFNRRKKKEEPMSPRDIGYMGSVDDFISAAQQGTNIFNDAPHLFIELSSGAADALIEGRPENLQAFFGVVTTNPDVADSYHLANVSRKMTTDQIKQALETSPSGHRQRLLDDALANAACWSLPGTEQQLKNLVEAGANPAANGQRALRNAVHNTLFDNAATLKSLGADFSEALIAARHDQTYGRGSAEDVMRLENLIAGLGPKNLTRPPKPA